SGGLNLVSSQTYDELGRIASSTDPGGTVTRYHYDPAGNRVQVVSYDQNSIPLSVSRTVFVPLHRPIYTQDTTDVPQNFDPAAEPTTVNASRHVYDPAGRLVRTERLHAVTLTPVVQEGALSMRFDGAGELVEDERGQATRTGAFLDASETDYDDAGRVRST